LGRSSLLWRWQPYLPPNYPLQDTLIGTPLVHHGQIFMQPIAALSKLRKQLQRQYL
jgi:hypothetical protein